MAKEQIRIMYLFYFYTRDDHVGLYDKADIKNEWSKMEYYLFKEVYKNGF